MNISSIPTTEEDIRDILTSDPQKRIQKQKQLIQQLGISPSQTTPYLDYVHHLQKMNGLEVCNDIQMDLYMAIESDPNAKRFLMTIG